jgi:methyl-accepting chemotaxis protein
VLTVCLVTLLLRAANFFSPNNSLVNMFAFGEFFGQYGAVLLVSLILVPIIMIDSLVTSNRFIRPVERLRRSMRALAAGEHVEPIQFRKDDFLQDLAQEFNAVIERVAQLQQESRRDETGNGALEVFQPASRD